MSENTGLAISEPIANGKAEKVDPVETLLINSTLLLAAELVAEKDGTHPALNGVHLHRVGAKGRAVGFDGERMFVGTWDLVEPVPSWLNSGITLLVEGLKKRIQMSVDKEGTTLKLSHIKGHGFVEMSDLRGDAVFKVGVINRGYPPYEQLITPAAFAALDDEGNVKGNEWRPVGFNSKHLKSCGDVAKALNAGLPKDDRSKEGMVIRAFNATENAPLIFDFGGWPGAIMLILPVRSATPQIAADTQLIFDRATKLTLAALRAHVTRQLAWAEAATNPVIKAQHEAKAAGFAERIAGIVARTRSDAQIAEPDPEPEAQPEPAVDAKPEEDEVQPEPEPEDDYQKPVIKRTKIRMPSNGAAA